MNGTGGGGGVWVLFLSYKFSCKNHMQYYQLTRTNIVNTMQYLELGF